MTRLPLLAFAACLDSRAVRVSSAMAWPNALCERGVAVDALVTAGRAARAVAGLAAWLPGCCAKANEDAKDVVTMIRTRHGRMAAILSRLPPPKADACSLGPRRFKPA